MCFLPAIYLGPTMVDFPGGSASKVSAYNDGDQVRSLGWEEGEGNDNPLQYSCLENPMDGEFW